MQILSSIELNVFTLLIAIASLEAEREELLEIIASLRRQLEGVQSQLQVSPRKRSSSYMLIDVACGRYDG